MNVRRELSTPQASTHGNSISVIDVKHAFSEADRQKMDRDIYLLYELAKGVERAYKGRLVVDFGWAVDALCDEKPTRVHHDIDARIILPEGVDQRKVFDFAVQVFTEHSDRRWYKQQAHPNWAAIVGEDYLQSTNQLEQLAASRTDLHALHSYNPYAQESQIEVISPQGTTYPMPLQRVTLADTSGRAYEFLAPTPEALATTKLQLIYSMRDDHEREFGETDVADLRRLFARPDFDKGKVTEQLQSYFRNVQHMGAEQACQVVSSQMSALGLDRTPKYPGRRSPAKCSATSTAWLLYRLLTAFFDFSASLWLNVAGIGRCRLPLVLSPSRGSPREW